MGSPQPEIGMLVHVDIAIVRRGGLVLVCQRLPRGAFAGYWEFPGGKREAGESAHACLARELREELAVVVRPLAALTPIDHDYPQGPIRLHAHLCEHVAGEPQPLACQQVTWVAPAALRGLCFPPANEALVERAVAWGMGDEQAD